MILQIAYCETDESYILDVFNDIFILVSGTSEPLYSYCKVIQEIKPESSTNYSMILVTNSTYTSKMKLHYIEAEYINNYTNILLNENPLYNVLANYSKYELKYEYGIDLDSIYKETEVIQVEIQEILFSNDSTYAILEVIFSAEGSLHKGYYIFNNTKLIKNYDWRISSESIIFIKSGAKYLAFIGLLISSGITAVIIYYYWNKKKKFPFIKLGEEEVIIRT